MGWLPWIASWTSFWIPVDRKVKEFIFTLLIENPLEFRVAYLAHSVKKLKV